MPHVLSNCLVLKSIKDMIPDLGIQKAFHSYRCSAKASRISVFFLSTFGVTIINITSAQKQPILIIVIKYK